MTLCVYLLFGLLCAQLLPVLASSLEFGSAAAPALTVLLKMGSWLPADQFSIKVTFSLLIMINTAYELSSSLINRECWPFSGLANYRQAFCLQWPSYPSMSFASHRSVWGINVSSNCWWTSMWYTLWTIRHLYLLHKIVCMYLSNDIMFLFRFFHM